MDVYPKVCREDETTIEHPVATEHEAEIRRIRGMGF
jgi:hypothetical protein